MASAKNRKSVHDRGGAMGGYEGVNTPTFLKFGNLETSKNVIKTFG